MHWVLKWYRIPWNLSFKILTKMIFNCAGWIDFHKFLISYNFLQVSFANLCFIINICIIPYMHFQHYSLRNKISFKISFQCSLKLFGQKVPWNFLQSPMELFEQHLNNICGSMEFHGILSRSKVPWNSMELFPHSRVPWNSMELLIFPQKVPWNSMEFHGTFLKFHGIPWNSMELDKFHI